MFCDGKFNWRGYLFFSMFINVTNRSNDFQILFPQKKAIENPMSIPVCVIAILWNDILTQNKTVSSVLTFRNS